VESDRLLLSVIVEIEGMFTCYDTLIGKPDYKFPVHLCASCNKTPNP